MDVVQRLRDLRRQEHACTVAIVENLVVCNRERRYLDYGCSTLWEFLTRELGYSNGAASRRFKAMKCVLRDPDALVRLRERRVTLSTLAEAESALGRADDPGAVLASISDLPQTEVRKVLAQTTPVSRPKENVRPVAVLADPLFSDPANDPIELRITLRTSLTEERYEAFERARAIVTRKRPGASVETVVNELVDFYLRHKAPRHRAKPGGGVERRGSGRKGAESASGGGASRHIPRATRDYVMQRDGERCTFVGLDGRRCAARQNLQIDHVRPFALGGTNDPDNLRVLCANHNRHQARRAFGAGKVPEREVPERN